MKTFREQALAAYAKHAEEQADWDRKRALEFARDATERLCRDWPFQAVAPDMATLEVEGIAIMARRQYGAPSYYMTVRCSQCEALGEVQVVSLSDVGELIQGADTHLCPDCKRPGRGYVETWQERLVSALMEGLQEEQRQAAEDYYTF